MTEAAVIAGVFDKEGRRYGDQHTVPPIDQPTAAGGITLGTLRAYVLDTRAALPVTIDTLRTLTVEAATPIVRWKLRKNLTLNRFDRVAFEPLRLQLQDFAYNSGPAVAIRWFQRVLRVPRTSVMDGATFASLERSDPWLVNQALIAARLEMIDRWTDSDKQAKAWEEGVESRGLTFSLLEVP